MSPASRKSGAPAPRAWALIAEAWASARSQHAASALTLLIVAAMCATALLTSGRAVAAQDAALARIDEAGTRAVIVRAASDQAQLTARLVPEIARIAEVEAVTGFGPLTDVRVAALHGGPWVAMRTMTHLGPDLAGLGGHGNASAGPPGAGTALVSASAQAELGLARPAGVLQDAGGMATAVVGPIEVPDHLRFLEPLILAVDRGPDPAAELAMIVVRARSAHEVAAVTDAVVAIIDPPEANAVSVETSQALADVRAAVSGELASQSRTTVLGALAISAVLVLVILTGLVTLRRRDFGRRRALGASQGLIIALLLAQTAITAVIGAGLGTLATLAGLTARGAPTPNPGYTAAIAVLALTAAVLGSLPPALYAATRDPLRELRVP